MAQRVHQCNKLENKNKKLNVKSIHKMLCAATTEKKKIQLPLCTLKDRKIGRERERWRKRERERGRERERERGKE